MPSQAYAQPSLRSFGGGGYTRLESRAAALVIWGGGSPIGGDEGWPDPGCFLGLAHADRANKRRSETE